jgi:hypothetical protein
MKGIDRTIDKIITVVYILFYATYEYISLTMFSDSSGIVTSDYLYIIILNILFLAISLLIVRIYKCYFVQKTIIFILILTIILNVLTYIKMSNLYPYSIYAIVLLTISKIFTIIFCSIEMVCERRKKIDN